MKKLLTLTLALILIISLLPMAALAAGSDTPPLPYLYHHFILTDPKVSNYDIYLNPDYSEAFLESPGDVSQKITFAPSKTIKYNGQYYDLHGVDVVPYYVVEIVGSSNPSAEDVAKVNKWLESHPSTNSTLTIPPYPSTNANGEQDAWCEKYSYLVFTIYGGHQHSYTCWLGDNNNHWVNCKVCKKDFLLMDWHHDYDEDDFCDICGHAIIYYNISIVEEEGAKVTVSGDRDMTAPYRDMIDVDLEVADGYELKELQVWKVRVDGTKARIRCTEVTEGSAYTFQMKNFDCEIVPIVVKK